MHHTQRRRILLLGAVLAISIGVAAGFYSSPPLARAAALLPGPTAQDPPAGAAASGTAIRPEVNAAAFKDQGNLAFIWQGLLYVLDGGSGEVKQLTQSGQALRPRWSPDGQWLAFVKVADPQAKSGSLWLVRRDGSQARQVAGISWSGVPDFSWSPAADVLAVGGKDGIWLVPVEGEPRRLVATAVTSSFAWSPYGRFLSYNDALPYDSNDPQSRSDALYTVAVTGGAPVKQIEVQQGGIIVAGWWPDGRGVLYRQVPLHSASLAADCVDLLSLPLGTAEPTRLASGLKHWLSLAETNKMVMVAGSGRIVWHNKQLAVGDPAAGSVEKLDNPAGLVALDPALSRDGQRIAFVAARDLGGQVWGFSKPEDLTAWVNSRMLWVENSDGSGARVLAAAGTGVYQPAWSRDDRHILYVRDNALWIVGADGYAPQKVVGPFPERQDLFGYYGYVSYGDIMAWFQ